MRLGLLVRRARRDQLVRLELPEISVQRVALVKQDPQEVQDPQALLVKLDPQEVPGQLERQARQVPRVLRVLPELQAKLGLRGVRERLVRLVK